MDVQFGWAGRDYVIPANMVLSAICVIEDTITLGELSSGRQPAAKIATAYAAMLNFAGARVGSEDVYAGMFGDSPSATSVDQAAAGLLKIMLPRDAFADGPATAAAPAPRRPRKSGPRAPVTG